MHEFKECLFMGVLSFHPKRWCFISNWVWYGLELRWSVSSVFGIVKFRLGTNDYKRQPAFHFYWRPHFIFDFSLVHSHLLGTGSCSWYRLGIYALCIILNMRKRKMMALDAPQINKKKSNLLDVCIFMLCRYIAISSFYFFSNFQTQSTILD